MPNNKRHTAKQIKGKDTVHPASRKAGQLDRIHLRSHKLQKAAKKRDVGNTAKLFTPLFFLSNLPSSSAMTLEALKQLIEEYYVTRFDAEIEALEANRRKGRPKEGKQLELEEKRRREYEEWEGSGIDIPDLTDSGNCRLIWQWKQKDMEIKASHLDCLRIVRVTKSCAAPKLVKKGKIELMGLSGPTSSDSNNTAASIPGDTGMEVEAAT